jgi:hypothetical protein
MVVNTLVIIKSQCSHIQKYDVPASLPKHTHKHTKVASHFCCKNEKNNSKYNGSVRGMNEMGEYIILYTSSTFAAGRIICERRVTCIISDVNKIQPNKFVMITFFLA